MKFHGKIINGELKIINTPKVLKEIKELGQDGLVEIELKFKDQRSKKLNRYFHHVIVKEFRRALRSVGWGEVKDNVQSKEIIKVLFLTRWRETKSGKLVKYELDTSTLSNREMIEVINEVIQFAAEWLGGYQIKYPNELNIDIDETYLK